jgi:hypothetical protein
MGKFHELRDAAVPNVGLQQMAGVENTDDTPNLAELLYRRPKGPLFW